MRTTKILLFITLSLSAFSQCSLVYNPFTNQFNCGGASGTVGGASNLTTVGAIPYVSAAGVLNQDAGLGWVNTSNINRLLLTDGSSQSSNPLIVQRWNNGFNKLSIGGSNNGLPVLTLFDGSGGQSLYILNAGEWRIWTVPNIPLSIGVNNGEAARFAATTRNLLIGTTTDSNFKLDVAASGSAGTARFYGGSGVSNSTKVVVQAGAGDGFGSWLTEWQNSSGTRMGGVQFLGGSVAQISGLGYFSGGLSVPIGSAPNFSNVGFMFSATASAGSGTYDLSLSRASAGVLQVGDGAANANGYLTAARIGVGTASPSVSIDSTGVISSGGGSVQIGLTSSSFKAVVDNGRLQFANFRIDDSGGGTELRNSGGGGIRINQATNSFIDTQIAGTTMTRVAATTGNLLIGTTTDDGTNKLQVLGSIYSTAGFASYTNDGVFGVNARPFVLGHPGGQQTRIGYFSTGDGNYAGRMAFSSTSTGTAYSFIGNGDQGAYGALVMGASNSEAARFAPTTRNLLIGTTTDDGTNKLQVAAPAGAIVANTAFLSPSMANGNKVYLTIGTSSSSNNSFTWLYNHSSTSSSRYLSVQPYEGQIGSSSTWFASSNMTVGDVTAAPLDPGFRFSVRSSGSSGTFRIFDEVPTTGVTKAVIRAGAGQSTTFLTEWQNAAGNQTLGATASDGAFITTSRFTARPSNLGTVDSGMGTGGFVMKSSATFAISSSSDADGTKDLSLSRASAGVLQVGDGGSNANGRVHAAGLRASAGNVEVFTGYGVQNANANGMGIIFPSSLIEFYAAGNIRVGSFSGGGTFTVYNETPTTGNTKEVIRAGAGQTTNLTEWQDNAGTALAWVEPTGKIVGNSSQISAGGFFNWVGRSQMFSPSDGNLTLYNAAGSDFGRFQFGGTTSSFPALKRNGNSFDVRLADDSAYAALQAVRLQTAAQTVSQLPAAAAGNAGSIQYVTDANATTIGSTVAGGGANKVMVWSDGAAWKIFAN